MYAQIADQVNSLPATPGVYFFHGEQALLYIGKSINIKARVRSHIQNATADKRADKMLRQTKKIDWIETSGELSALLLEAELIKSEMPMYNRKLRRHKTLMTISLERDKTGYLVPKPTVLTSNINKNVSYGAFKHKRAINLWLEQLAKAEGLCRYRLNLESRRPCFGIQLKQCDGYCQDDDMVDQFNQVLLDNLAKQRIETWPFDSPVNVVEKNDVVGDSIYTVDNWQLKQVSAPNWPKSILSLHSFDYDTYKILYRWLALSTSEVTIEEQVEHLV